MTQYLYPQEPLLQPHFRCQQGQSIDSNNAETKVRASTTTRESNENVELKSIINLTERIDSLPTSLELSNLPLKDCLDKWIILYLNISGVVIPKSLSLSNMWSIAVLMLTFGFYSISGFVDIFFNIIFKQNELIPHMLYCCGILIQGISMVCIVVHARIRMLEVVKKVDLFVYPSCVWNVLLAVLSFVTPTFPMIVYGFFYFPRKHYFIHCICCFGLLGGAMLLSVNLLFLIVDTKVSLILLSALIEQEGISLQDYNKVKAEIQARVQKSQRSNNIVMCIAVMNVLVVFLIMVISEEIFSHVVFIILLIASMSKEVLYTLIGFWYVALVNEKVIELTRHISLNAANIDDPERSLNNLKLFSISVTDPISFPLATMVFTRRDVWNRFLIWLVGIFIGISRQQF